MIQDFEEIPRIKLHFKTGIYSLRQAPKIIVFFGIVTLIFSIVSGSSKFLLAVETPPEVAVSASVSPEWSLPLLPHQLLSILFSLYYVSEIHFDGNTLNKSGALEKKIKTKLKKTLDKKQLKEDVKLLFETGDFEDVRADVTYLEKKDSKGRAGTGDLHCCRATHY